MSTGERRNSDKNPPRKRRGRVSGASPKPNSDKTPSMIRELAPATRLNVRLIVLAVMLVPLWVIMGWIFDFLLPALGGPLEIWLITAKGREIKAWQGHNQDQFDVNLKLLQDHTTAELKTRCSQ